MTDASTTTKASTKTAPKAAAAPAPESKAVELLQRVIFPRPGEPLDVRSLYLVEADGNQRRAHSPSRTSVVIGGESEVSFETYFNAFAAAYWRRWTTLTSVVLRVELTGTARVDLYRSKIDGSRIGIGGDLVPVDEQGRGVIEFELDLGPFEDGGWIWFDITTDTDTEITSAGWYSAVASPNPDATVTVGIPTFNRPTDAVAALAALSSDPLVDAVIDAVIMPDQGTRRVVDEPGFDEAAAALGDRLHMFKQGNLGGSGGYSRIMYEALRLTDSPYVLYMDDDIAIEPDSILRALAMSRFAKTPMLVGGQMLNLQDRSHLHCMGEVINRHTFMWTAAPFVEYDHDFSKYPMSDRDNSKNLHRRIDVEGNGWWMCMIPRECAETIGLPMPLFIKWDDWEFALRAAKAGYPTATVPGIAIWHMAWSDKDDAIDWQAYFHLRNRLVVASIHHDGPINGILTSMAKATAKHLLCLEYSTVAIQNEAIRDFLAGPDHIRSILPTALGKIAGMRKEFPDAVVLPSATDLPPATGEATALGVNEPKNPAVKVLTLAKAIRNNLRPADPRHHEVPQANYPPIEARWYSLGRVDGVTVTTADGRGVVYRQRDRDKALALGKESAALVRELRERFPEMKQKYRDAHADLTSKESWANVFGID
ncbi:MAG TPA: glycosyltransferase [Gordonia sp. (in: high G+C Gram-positive bacteria)]|uniref:glycosyltransferase n=1 Tax=unclassified Gordonia (in: high G+C Gram-positive bacteria) TaxID=2657482 RepID=UPI000FABF564|nr:MULTISPECIES: glycosyltransferase [unclassified Gordonia (in: high G+C Gram-positive bacteria)]RUP40753.1 MAG: glycosyltransferase family 2 protein [Gordonia sp. (in: high G+C Gram-positive bacteria)]HNP58039.1 glycosyltransferase [Gordonia sp. (in: high G+C Gram-positive bacteria)]HRC52287.1 glycosyltransferase [Gordonia sp. (in: high G+C Gram-positive bacteria)]